MALTCADIASAPPLRLDSQRSSIQDQSRDSSPNIAAILVREPYGRRDRKQGRRNGTSLRGYGPFKNRRCHDLSVKCMNHIRFGGFSHAAMRLASERRLQPSSRVRTQIGSIRIDSSRELLHVVKTFHNACMLASIVAKTNALRVRAQSIIYSNNTVK